MCITGAAGQIAYSLLTSVCKGDVFGPTQVISRAQNEKVCILATNWRNLVAGCKFLVASFSKKCPMLNICA